MHLLSEMGKRQQILGALPNSAKEISQNLGIDYSWVRRILREERLAGRIRIYGWRRRVRTSGDLSPIYAKGGGPDQPRPAAEPAKIACARYRARKKALVQTQGEHHEQDRQ